MIHPLQRLAAMEVITTVNEHLEGGVSNALDLFPEASISFLFFFSFKPLGTRIL